MLFLLLIAKKLVAASGRKQSIVTGSYRPVADCRLINKSVLFSEPSRTLGAYQTSFSASLMHIDRSQWLVLI